MRSCAKSLACNSATERNGSMNPRTIRATSLPHQAGAYYVRIQAMAVKHHIALEEEFDEFDTPETKYIVLVDDVLPVATVRMIPVDEETILLGRIVVLPEYRHKGIGSLAVGEAEQWARELGYKKAVLESRDNKLDFYKRLGYTADEGTVIHGTTFTCIPMEKNL